MMKVISFFAGLLDAVLYIVGGPNSHAEVRYSMPCAGAVKCLQAGDVTCEECGFSNEEAKQ